MSAPTHATHRLCPYCGASVKLSECPIVATNYDEAEFRSAEELHAEEIELPSGRTPLRLLPKTSWPVVAEAPTLRGVEDLAEANATASRLEQAFEVFRDTDRGAHLRPILEEEGVAQEDLPARACTNCEFPLPSTIDVRPAVVVAVVGVNRVGKTHLVATSLTQAYRKDGLKMIGCTEFAPDERTGSRFMQEYFTPLYRRGEILDATWAEDDEIRFKPLVFNVTLEGLEPFSLIIHDVAGEVLGDERKRAVGATYLRAARGVIFVIDPRDIDSLRTALPVSVLENNELGWDQSALLSACLRDDGFLAHRQPVPVAVTLAKSDLLPQAVSEELPFLARAQPDERMEDFVKRVRDSSRQVADFLDRQGAHNLLGPAREYERRIDSSRAGVTFHAVSALGKAPDSEERLTGEVEPINCLDPLAAVLAQL